MKTLAPRRATQHRDKSNRKKHPGARSKCGICMDPKNRQHKFRPGRAGIED